MNRKDSNSNRATMKGEH